jgi:putative endonuclease
MSWHTYILICADGTYYTGITTDLTRRVEEHNSTPKGSRYTAARRPVKLIHKEVYANRSLASQREYAIKQMSRGEKEMLWMKK